ncbi:MAG: 3-phosphoshikimate 1-carboxyvinyltransferase [Candidatus Kryptoniota bacterium]
MKNLAFAFILIKMQYEVKSAASIQGTFTVPGDKSISHRALLLASLADGDSEIYGLSTGDDVRSTEGCLKALGVQIKKVTDGGDSGRGVVVTGKNKRGFSPPVGVLDAGNSGTTMRLLTGVLAGQKFESVITGDETLRRRPMQRIVDPLLQMGANIVPTYNMTAPIRIFPSDRLKGIKYELPLPSAQVKSALLFAGLFAEGETVIVEPVESRDHTERMLGLRKELVPGGYQIKIKSEYQIKPMKYTVPGDISSAAFFLSAAAILPGSSVTARAITVNPTRTGFLEVLKKMGAKVVIENVMIVANEPIGDVTVSHSELHGIEIKGDIIPRVIDELPIIAVVGAFAEGETVVRDAHDLRRKESDRIVAVVDNLASMGANVEELDDGFVVRGTGELSGSIVDSYKDHRMAMAFTIAGICAKGKTIVKNAEWASISFPEFFTILEKLIVRS